MRHVTLLLVCLAASSATATETYVLQGRGIGAAFGAECKVYRWDSDVLFHNRGDAPATVRLIGVSNGGPLQPVLGGNEFTIAGHQTTTLGQNALWEPALAAPLWVVRFDAPDAVTIESRMAVGYDIACVIVGVPPGVGMGAFGKLSFTVYRALQAANVPKVHLGTDAARVPSRVNVSVYNAGIVPAVIRVELRQVCDDRVLNTRDANVPPDTVVQLFGFRNSTLCSGNARYGYMTYVTVTSDQPSLSWISVLANNDEVKATYGAPASSP